MQVDGGVYLKKLSFRCVLLCPRRLFQIKRRWGCLFEGGGSANLVFFQIVRCDLFCNTCTCHSLRSLRRILSLFWEICSLTSLAILSLLHKGGWALGNEPTDPHYIRCDGQWAVLGWVESYLLVIEHDLNYTSFVVSVHFHKPEGGDDTEREGDPYLREGANF